MGCFPAAFTVGLPTTRNADRLGRRLECALVSCLDAH